jgi:hypothetical protein
MLTKIRLWIASLFLPANVALILTAVRSVVDILDVAIPVVAKINDEVKPALDAGASVEDVIEQFLKDFGVNAAIEQLAALPRADLLHGLAVLAIESLVKQPMPRSALRLGAEIAYWVYKTVVKK